MKKVVGSLLIAVFSFTWMGCNNDESDNRVAMDLLPNKYWYENRWVPGNDYSYSLDDHMVAIKFDGNGSMYELNVAGREKNKLGSWMGAGTAISITKEDGKVELWNIRHISDHDLETVVNTEGSHYYTNEPRYIQDLTADAFYVSEYNDAGQGAHYLGAVVKGNDNIRDAAIILSDSEHHVLAYKGLYWGINSDQIRFAPSEHERMVKFYIRAGSADQFKLVEYIDTDLLPERTPTSFNLLAENIGGSSDLTISWNPIERDDVYYQIEVFDQNKNELNPYFVSKIQPPGANKLIVRENSAGAVNRISEVTKGETLIVRLTSILYEDGVDPINDKYGEGNVQSVIYIEKKIIWQ